MLCFSRITGTCYRKLHFGVFCLDRWDHQLSYYYFQSFLVAGAASESTPLSESALNLILELKCVWMTKMESEAWAVPWARCLVFASSALIMYPDVGTWVDAYCFWSLVSCLVCAANMLNLLALATQKLIVEPAG